MLKTLRVINLLILTLIIGCSSVERNSETPEGAFAIAEEYDQSERYEEAIRRYTEIKNKFPYSNYATRAELAIADVYFKQESYAEAQISYQMFRELHPTVPNADYVQYRIGLSYFMQLPSTIDRDLSVANEAILNLSDFIRRFPNSEYAKDAQDKRSQTIKMLAEKEEYIADFYFKRKIYTSALARYENLYTSYSGLGFDEKVLSRAAYSAQKIGDASKAKRYLDLLAKNHPDSKELKSLREEVN